MSQRHSRARSQGQVASPSGRGGRLLVIVGVAGMMSSFAACSSTRAGFDGETSAQPTAPTEAGPAYAFEPDASATDSGVKDECQKMDVVFVIDDSGSMGPKQQKLRANFPRFVDVLDQYKTKTGSELDYRLAVTSTDTERSDLQTGGKGGFVTSSKSSCLPGPSRAWLERSDPTVASAFSCRAGLGTEGSTLERPLAALQLSLTNRLADQNRNFVRDDALLAFVIVTDEEDGSENAPNPSGLVAELDRLKTLRGRWAGAVISGPASASCGGGSVAGGGDPSPRLHELVEKSADPASGRNNVIWRTICQESFDTAVKDALDTFTVACRDLPALPR
ncbi:MAG: hypothetical protein JST00_34970 [Deltaproteobacteria bacterium]|nr:hypothetical protein [Deltaproteobacteria bacterium]